MAYLCSFNFYYSQPYPKNVIFDWELDFVLGNFPFLKLKALTSGTEDYITAWKKL